MQMTLGQSAELAELALVTNALMFVGACVWFPAGLLHTLVCPLVLQLLIHAHIKGSEGFCK